MVLRNNCVSLHFLKSYNDFKNIWFELTIFASWLQYASALRPCDLCHFDGKVGPWLLVASLMTISFSAIMITSHQWDFVAFMCVISHPVSRLIFGMMSLKITLKISLPHLPVANDLNVCVRCRWPHDTTLCKLAEVISGKLSGLLPQTVCAKSEWECVEK